MVKGSGFVAAPLLNGLIASRGQEFGTGVLQILGLGYCSSSFPRSFPWTTERSGAGRTHPQASARLSRRGHWMPSVRQPSFCLSQSVKPPSVCSRSALRAQLQAGEEAGLGGFDPDWSWKAEARGKVQQLSEVDLVLGKVILEPSPHQKSARIPACFLSVGSSFQTSCTLWAKQAIAGECPEEGQQS